MSLVQFSIKRPILISMFFLLFTLIGINSFRSLPVEVMPNMSFGHITININVRGGIPALEIEKSISKPVEESVSNVAHLKDIISISKEGNSMIILEFEPGTNMEFAALEVRENFNRIKNKLPDEIEKPIIAKYEYTDVPIMIIAITSNIRSPEEIRKIVDEKIKSKIQRIEGIAKVEVAGGRESKILIEIDKYKLQAFSLPVNTIVDTINANNINLLAGEIKREKDKYMVRTIGEFHSLKDIENLGIATTEIGSIIRIKDVARIKDSYLDPREFSRVDTRPSVSLYVQKESLANTVKIASLVEKEIKNIEKYLEKDININLISNKANDIKKAIQRVKIALLLGAILAFVILFLFLRDIAVINIIGVAIPISVFFTFMLMFFSKLSINLMTLTGLALGVGLLVDNSIVVIENVFKKLENISGKHNFEKIKQFCLSKKLQRDIAAEGTEEVFLAITASTLTTLAVFLSLTYLNPEIKMLYSSLALTISFSLCASLLSALTLVPMLISRIKIKSIDPRRKLKFAPFKPSLPEYPLPEENPLFTEIKKTKIFPSYEKAIKTALRWRYPLVSLAIILFIVTVHQASKLEKEFIGIAEQNKFTIFIEMPTGTQLEFTDKIVSKVEKFVAKMPEIKTITARVEPWSSKLYVELKPFRAREFSAAEVINKIRPFTEKLQPAFIYFEESQEVGTKEILLDIFGYDYEILKNIAMQIGQRMQAIPRFTDTKIRMREGRSEMSIKIDKAKAALSGLNVRHISLALHAQLRGLVATRYRGTREPILRIKEKQPFYSRLELKDVTYSKQSGEKKEIETIVRLEEKFRKTFEDLKRLSFVSSDGKTIYLSQIANFSFDIGPSEIWRKNRSRMIQVSSNTGGTALGTAGRLVEDVLSGLKLPKDYFWQFGGNYDKMLRNQKELMFASILSLLIIYMILASLFESFIQPLIILITVPLAFIGAIFALQITNKPINIGVLIGGILLAGIVVNNAIILVDRINFLKKQTGDAGHYNIIVKASLDRLRPIIMTSLTTIASMTFIALDKSASSNLWAPLAITVIGGMIISSLSTPFVTPCLYLIFEDFKLLTRKK